jgi:hypothetical protein
MKVKMQHNNKGLGLGLRALAIAAPLFAALPMTTVMADDAAPSLTFGAGLRTSFVHTSNEEPIKDANDFNVDNIRLYVNGSVTPYLKFTFNTEYQGSPPNGNNSLQLLDAIARLEINDQFHLWAGRFLAPTDRANLYGVFYNNNTRPFNDGVQDGYPSEFAGRDNGLAYWGQFGIIKVQAGVFDVPQTQNDSKVLVAGRIQADFWDSEPGYYLNGTYYGEKNILAVGLAGQTVADQHAWNVDFLGERNFPGVGTFTVEGEYARYDRLGGYGGFDGSFAKSNGFFGLASYLFPQNLGVGKIQLLGKYGQTQFDASSTVNALEYHQRTLELNVNYVIKKFDARVGLFFLNTTLNSGLPDSKQYGVSLSIQI